MRNLAKHSLFTKTYKDHALVMANVFGLVFLRSFYSWLAGPKKEAY